MQGASFLSHVFTQQTRPGPGCMPDSVLSPGTWGVTRTGLSALQGFQVSLEQAQTRYIFNPTGANLLYLKVTFAVPITQMRPETMVH